MYCVLCTGWLVYKDLDVFNHLNLNTLGVDIEPESSGEMLTSYSSSSMSGVKSQIDLYKPFKQLLQTTIFSALNSQCLLLSLLVPRKVPGLIINSSFSKAGINSMGGHGESVSSEYLACYAPQ